MKKFYLERHEDVHGNSGTGAVAEGVIFDNGMAAMTWLSDEPTVTTFVFPRSIKKLHGHNGRTDVVIEGQRGQAARFQELQEIVRQKKNELRHEKAERGIIHKKESKNE